MRTGSLLDGENREHASSFPKFHPIRVVTVHVRSGADPAVDYLPNPSCPALRNDLRGEIDLVFWRANARAELRDHAVWLTTVFRNHLFNRYSRDAKSAPYLSRMQKSDCAADRIDEVDGAAIRHINAEANAGTVRDESIRSRHWGHRVGIHGDDIYAMDLLGDDEAPRVEAKLGADRCVSTTQEFQRAIALDLYVESRGALREGVLNR